MCVHVRVRLGEGKNKIIYFQMVERTRSTLLLAKTTPFIFRMCKAQNRSWKKKKKRKTGRKRSSGVKIRITNEK